MACYGRVQFKILVVLSNKTRLKWQELLEMARNGWKRLQLLKITGNDLKWLNKDGNVAGMARNG